MSSHCTTTQQIPLVINPVPYKSILLFLVAVATSSELNFNTTKFLTVMKKITRLDPILTEIFEVDCSHHLALPADLFAHLLSPVIMLFISLTANDHLLSPAQAHGLVTWHRYITKGLLFWYIGVWFLIFGLPASGEILCFCCIPPLKCHKSYLGDKINSSSIAFGHRCITCWGCRQIRCWACNLPWVSGMFFIPVQSFCNGSVWVRIYRSQWDSFITSVFEGSVDTVLLC